MTVHEAALKLEVSDSTVYSLTRHGLLGCSRIGMGRGRIIITDSDLHEFLERCRKKPLHLPCPAGLKPLTLRCAAKK